MMLPTLSRLVSDLGDPELLETGVIDWGSPIPVFGDIENSSVASLGLNPSNREFVDEVGYELEGELRRFHTLGSLGLNSWLDADSAHLDRIINSYQVYFSKNPYDTWFKKLNEVIATTGASYYAESHQACHIDLIPFATKEKWNNLSNQARSKLVSVAGDTLGRLLKNYSIDVLILNGASVISQFESLAGIAFERTEMPRWTLPRRSGRGVPGIAFRGILSKFGDSDLDSEVLVLGFNHNLQSSFGVTREVVQSIKEWVGANCR